MMSDTSAFTPTHRKSSSSGNVIIDEDIPAGAPVTKYQWTGRAVIATDIVISATALGPVSATGSFGIQSRIGLGPNWQDPDFLDFQEVPPAANFVAGAPLSAPYPGIKADSNDPNGSFASEAALGYTFFKYPSGATIVTFASGPNKGVKVLLKTSWEVEKEAGGAAAGIYIEQSLRSSDPFYLRQVGESPYCTQADMKSLSSLIQGHEAAHWTEARAATKPLKIQTALEALVQLPGGPSILDARQAIQDAFGFAAAAANADVEHNIAPLKGHRPVCDMRP